MSKQAISLYEVNAQFHYELAKHDLQSEWCLGWDGECSNEEILAWCDFDNSIVWLSQWDVENGLSREEVLDTILHEIAHILDYENRGDEIYNTPHGPAWIKLANALGAETIHPNTGCPLYD
jgi:hypothetical protein